MSSVKKNFVYTEKCRTVTTVQLQTFKKHFGILLLASYCYCGDNA